MKYCFLLLLLALSSNSQPIFANNADTHKVVDMEMSMVLARLNDPNYEVVCKEMSDLAVSEMLFRQLDRNKEVMLNNAKNVNSEPDLRYFNIAIINDIFTYPLDSTNTKDEKVYKAALYAEEIQSRCTRISQEIERE